MVSLRHNKLWLVLTVVCALVFTGTAAPARALTCLEMPAPAAVQETPQPSCESMGQAGPCCCGPKVSEHQQSGATAALAAPGCDCTVQAPTDPPPSLNNGVRIPIAEALLNAPAAPAVLPRAPTRFLHVAARGVPRAPHRAPSLSRGPPAG
jgi:hypothetical protein